jgi:hypothetical protein
LTIVTSWENLRESPWRFSYQYRGQSLRSLAKRSAATSGTSKNRKLAVWKKRRLQLNADAAPGGDAPMTVALGAATIAAAIPVDAADSPVSS